MQHYAWFLSLLKNSVTRSNAPHRQRFPYDKIVAKKSVTPPLAFHHHHHHHHHLY